MDLQELKMNYIIETERLKLRELTLDDTDKLALVLSDPQSMRFYPHPFSREEVEHWIKWNIDNYKKYGFGLWAVIEKESDEFIQEYHNKSIIGKHGMNTMDGGQSRRGKRSV